MSTKICKKCLQEKPIDCFQIIVNKYVRKTTRKHDISTDRRRSTCIKCNNDSWTKNYVEKNKDRVYTNMKAYQKEQCANNTDVYAKKQLKNTFDISAKQVTKEMITLRKTINEIQREIR